MAKNDPKLQFVKVYISGTVYDIIIVFGTHM